jgi:DNA-binding beta-propeller fold protein YncE
MGLVGAVTVVGFSKDRTENLGGKQAGGPRLISVERPREPEGEMCAWAPASASLRLGAALQQGAVSAAQAGAADARKPVRFIKDSYGLPTAIAVDPVRNEIVMTDENLMQLLVYDRLANTPPTAAFTEPKRVIRGPRTQIQFQCGLYIDPVNGDIYAPNNETHDAVVIFSRQAKGNVPPDRTLYTPRGGLGIAVDERAQEMYITGQHESWIGVWKKTAQGDDEPIRLIQGERTGLADPHGIALDPKNRWIFVTNFGNVHSVRPGGRPAPSRGGGRATGKKNWPEGEPVPGSGKSLPPSITIHALDAQGDAPPLRTIEGPNTQLNWPTGIAFEATRNELYIANDTGNEILVFSAADSGNVAPVRILKGPKTLIKNPTGVFVDTKNDELWVANAGNHSATVYKPTAAGDTPPLRVIRTAPLGAGTPFLGQVGAIAFDAKRDEILVPN